MRSSKSRLLAQLVFACVAAVGVAPTGGAADSFALKAMVSFSEQLAPPTASGCSLSGQIEGAGINPHLGKFTLRSQDCIVQLTPTGTEFMFTSTSVVLTAGNGNADQLTGSYGGTLVIDPSTGIATIKDGNFIITGGSGRLANAKGTGRISGFEQINGLTGQGQIQLDGTISY